MKSIKSSPELLPVERGFVCWPESKALRLDFFPRALLLPLEVEVEVFASTASNAGTGAVVSLVVPVVIVIGGPAFPWLMDVLVGF